MKQKTFSGFIICNWKTGKSCVRHKKNGKKETPYDIAVPYNIKITLPEFKDAGIVLDIDIPKVDVSELSFK